MNKRQNSETWPYSPWIGETATAQFALWNAGIEWANMTNWFSGFPVGSIPTPVGHVDLDKPIERPTDLITSD
jgi:hypothetical protein